MASVNARAEEYKESGAFGDTPMDALRARAYLDLINGLPAAERIATAETQDDAADPAESLARAQAHAQARAAARAAAEARSAADAKTGNGTRPEPDSDRTEAEAAPDSDSDPDERAATAATAGGLGPTRARRPDAGGRALLPEPSGSPRRSSRHPGRPGRLLVHRLRRQLPGR